MSQEVLDAVCNRYSRAYNPLVVNWSIGKRNSVAADLAKGLGRPVAYVEEQLTVLIRANLLTGEPYGGPRCTAMRDGRLGITHQGWLRWTDFDDVYVEDHSYATLEEWLAWGGADNYPEGGFPEAFPEKPGKGLWRSVFDPWSPSIDHGR